MKNILDYNNNEIKNFFFKNESYINVNMPTYFNFETLLSRINNTLGDNYNITDFLNQKMRIKKYILRILKMLTIYS